MTKTFCDNCNTELAVDPLPISLCKYYRFPRFKDEKKSDTVRFEVKVEWQGGAQHMVRHLCATCLTEALDGAFKQPEAQP